MRAAFARNLNTAIVLAGFVWLEVGIASHWSGAVASMVGGCVLMLVGSWPYLIRTLRKRA